MVLSGAGIIGSLSSDSSVKAIGSGVVDSSASLSGV